jgi:hypothetical protein
VQKPEKKSGPDKAVSKRANDVNTMAGLLLGSPEFQRR